MTVQLRPIILNIRNMRDLTRYIRESLLSQRKGFWIHGKSRNQPEITYTLPVLRNEICRRPEILHIVTVTGGKFTVYRIVMPCIFESDIAADESFLKAVKNK